MSNQLFNELSIKEIISGYNVIVPEIQREYVWGNNDYHVLESFFSDIKEGYNKHINNVENYECNIYKCVGSLNEISQSNKAKIIEALKKMNPDYSNIGFLYSYRPDYSIYEDVNEDVYLIDGQQRFTTLFLLLFYFSLREPNKSEAFKKIFRYNESLSKIAFDYRVRNTTHEFIMDLVKNVKEISQVLDIQNEKWFLSKYKDDITIKSIIGDTSNEKEGFFKIAHLFFQNKKGDYFTYLLNHVKFWHFKTEETSQGEELYITMNSRGQQLADNETIRANVFEAIEEKDSLEWSKKWELWQDFFWKYRDKDDTETTADKGFNEFLRWVQICEMTKASCKKDDVLKIINWTESSSLDVKYLKPDVIKGYFKSLEYLYKKFKNDFSIDREYPDLNKNNIGELLKTEWLSPKKNQISNIDCFKLLPILIYVQKSLDEETSNINKKNLFRFIKYVNNLARNENIVRRASKYLIDIIKLSDLLDKNDDVTKVLDLTDISQTFRRVEEEKIKLELLRDSNEREKLEILFWTAEDIKINNGEIAHIIKLSKEINNGSFDVDTFANVLERYKEFIHNNRIIWGDLINTNVYKAKNDRITFMSNWHISKGFLDFLKDYINKRKELEDFLQDRRKEFIREYISEDNLKDEKDIKKQLYTYFIIMNKMDKWDWKKGKKFGVYYEEYENRKPLFNSKLSFQHYKKYWQYNNWRFVDFSVFNQNKNYLQEIIDWASNYNYD